MTNEYETIKEWVGNNFMFNLPDAIYNLDACLRSRLHITFKGISGIYIIRNLITDKGSNSTKYTCEEFCTMFNMTKTPIRNIIHLRSWKYEDCIPEGYVPPKSMKR